MSLARSLKRLRTDYVDLLQFHSCAAATLQADDLIAALVRTKEKGLARAIGYSGDGADALYAVETGVFDVLQISVNIADQEAIDLAIPAAVARDMGIIAKRPIANAAWLLNRWRVGDYEKPYWRRLKRLGYDFLRGEPQAAVRTALRFTLGVPGVDTAIVGTTRPSRWAENAELWPTVDCRVRSSTRFERVGLSRQSPIGEASVEVASRTVDRGLPPEIACG